MFKTIVRAFKNKEIRNKILITLLLLFLYRLGCYIPVPGLNISSEYFTENFQNANNFLALLSSISGGALANGALLAIGISPYINASIIIQLLTIAIPPLERLSKQGDDGRKKINQITRYATVALAIAQAAGIVVNFANAGQSILVTKIFGVENPEWVTAIFVGLVLVAGSIFTMWLGEKITEIGVGNGISLLIFVGILSTAAISIIATVRTIIESARFPNQDIGNGKTGSEMVSLLSWQLVLFFVMVVVIFALVVFIDLAERKIPINYAKQIKGRKQYGGQSTHIPIKVNGSGVLPIIFATALISFPSLIVNLFFDSGSEASKGFFEVWNAHFAAGAWAYNVLVAALIFFFSYFYAQVQFNPNEVARNIQQYGGFIPGIRPGKPTEDYLSRISKRITLFGAIFLAFVALVPSLVFRYTFTEANMLVNAFSATGFLIAVSVALEFEKQLDSLLMMKQYKGFLK